MRSLALLVLCLVPLAACGTVGPQPTPASPLSVLSPSTKSPSSGASPLATSVGITVVLDPGHNGANASNPGRRRPGAVSTSSTPTHH